MSTIDDHASYTILNASQNFYVRGGSDRYFFVLSELLQQHGHRVIPFSSRQPKDEPSEWSRYFPAGVDFQKPGPRDIARFLYSRPAKRALRRLLADEKIDLAHLHIYYGQLTGSILAPLDDTGVPIVQTLHDFKLVCPVYSLLSHGKICEACEGKHFYRAVTNRCNRGSLTRSALSAAETYLTHWLGAERRIDQFITVSDFQRRKCIELGVPAEKMTTVRNFADPAQFEPATGRGGYLLYFGRVEQLKGIFTLLAAAEQVRDVPLWIVGTGDADAQVAEIVKSRGLNHVRLLGFRGGAELHETIRGSIATILPSEGYDNCPMSVLESLALSRPVIGSRIGGIPELVEHERDGLLVTPGNADDLAAQMRRLARDPAEAVEMGIAGRQKIETQFNPEIHYQQVAEVYRRVLAARGRMPRTSLVEHDKHATAIADPESLQTSV
ncbi:MAG: glycosyltransferase family 4 protein [Pirellulales bacterium]|nr:glycosyltransferase family 4 protein [Pirellulales bacterium]